MDLIPKHDPEAWYGSSAPPLREKLAHDSKICEDLINQNFGQEAELARRILDFSYEIACHYVWCFDAPMFADKPEKLDILFSAFHKSLFTLSSCIDLTCRGFYGPARPLLRHVFEFLVTAKFCNISTNPQIYKKWTDGGPVYFTNGVLRKIRSPDITPIIELWGHLNELTHATSSSSQVGLHFPLIAVDTQINLALIRVFGDWLAHLFTQHIVTSTMRYATRRYTPAKLMLKSAEQRLMETRKISRSHLSKDSKRLIMCYRSKWIAAE
jgi:hypothetical protein